MPSAPKTRKLLNAPSTPTRQPERRDSSSQRGYNQSWTDYAANLRRDRVFCDLCMEAFGVETPCAGQTTTETGRKRAQGVVDHIIPVTNASDPLFWDEHNHWVLCDVGGSSCNRFKSLHFDGTYGKRKIEATSRDRDGIARRRRDIVEAIKKDRQPPVVV